MGPPQRCVPGGRNSTMAANGRGATGEASKPPRLPRWRPRVAKGSERCDGIHRSLAAAVREGGADDRASVGRGGRRIGFQSAGRGLGADEAARHSLPLRLGWSMHPCGSGTNEAARPSPPIARPKRSWRSTGMMLGSVSLTVASPRRVPGHRGTRRGTEPARLFGRLVLGVGDPTEGSAAVRFALHEAQVRRGTVDAVRAWRYPAQEHADVGRPGDRRRPAAARPPRPATRQGRPCPAASRRVPGGSRSAATLTARTGAGGRG